MKNKTQIAIDDNNCTNGTPEGNRMSIATGDVNGIMDIQNANGPLGSSVMGTNNMIVNINGIVTGNVNCCESVSLSTADPTAAKRAA